MIGAPDWMQDGRDWPNRKSSRFVVAGGLRWHVQIMGGSAAGRPAAVRAPVILLLHGMGASTHSWRDLAPLLATRFTVVAPDLPGHGFSSHPAPALMTSVGMARAVAALLKTLDMQPAMVVGHSAGAAVGARLMLLHLIAAVPMVSLNGALSPMPEHQGALYSLMARALSNSPATSWVFALQARREKTVDRLLAATGSRIDADGRKFYARLMSRPGHVGGALRMMARWNLDDLDLTKLEAPVTLIVGDQDGMVPPEDATRVQARLPHGRVVMLPGLGHLAHEEAPGMVARLIEDAMVMDQARQGALMMVADCA
ncbi:alpha/beta fold hydrolase BchO [Acidisoma cladoniae]|uniref:alpha/beta fold hydrolase BchO n=1 Tax=Acidisoma cladoniae TaxID=3040935 RepID=UPI00254DC5B9|nr:alpha/beta fold hydrolase BchO [Acidisoma sp. PAMC 29798]